MTLASLTALLARMTPGPWAYRGRTLAIGTTAHRLHGEVPTCEANNAGIVTLRNLAPELVAVCEAATTVTAPFSITVYPNAIGGPWRSLNDNRPDDGLDWDEAMIRLMGALAALRAKMEGMG